MTDRILVVEDDKKISRIIELQLKHNGYEVELAYDGESDKDMFYRNKYHLIILQQSL